MNSRILAVLAAASVLVAGCLEVTIPAENVTVEQSPPPTNTTDDTPEAGPAPPFRIIGMFGTRDGSDEPITTLVMHLESNIDVRSENISVTFETPSTQTRFDHDDASGNPVYNISRGLTTGELSRVTPGVVFHLTLPLGEAGSPIETSTTFTVGYIVNGAVMEDTTTIRAPSTFSDRSAIVLR